MSVIADARDIPAQRWETAEQMDAWLARQAERRGVTVVDDTRTVTPYVNHGRWVADCPECCNGLACWDANPRATCFLCGHRYVLDWPDPLDRAAADAALAPRKVAHRNWNAHQGEQAIDLERETVVAMRGEH